MMINNFVDLPPNLLRGIIGELDEISFYETLLNLAEDEEDKKMITRILEDEKSHYNKFYCVYVKLTDNKPILPEAKEYIYNDYIQGLKSAILNEIRAYELYRDIYIAHGCTEAERVFLHAMTDENKHVLILNYLLAGLNKKIM